MSDASSTYCSDNNGTGTEGTDYDCSGCEFQCPGQATPVAGNEEAGCNKGYGCCK